MRVCGFLFRFVHPTFPRSERKKAELLHGDACFTCTRVCVTVAGKMCVCCQPHLLVSSSFLRLAFVSRASQSNRGSAVRKGHAPSPQGCFICADDVIFVLQAWARGAQHSFPPSFRTFISMLNQHRDAGGRGLSGTRGSTQGTQPAEMRTDVHGTLSASGTSRTFHSHVHIF